MSSNLAVTGELSTSAVLTTRDGRQINLGQLDKRIGIKIDLFGKLIDLTVPFTPRLWFYKYITYPHKTKLMKKEK